MLCICQLHVTGGAPDKKKQKKLHVDGQTGKVLPD